jgi:phosphoglycolate phosphatase/pyrophosphatase PpaX
VSRTKPTTAVVFDLDGTLVDSLPLVIASIAHAIEPYGRRLTTDEIFARLGGPPERFLPEMLDDPANGPAALARMERYHHENHHLIQPFDGVSPVLAQLRQGGMRLGIWTGRDRETTDWLLGHHQLVQYFDTVVCGDDLSTHKPDPEGLQEIMRRLGVRAHETLFVGDADVDVQGGVACGVDTLLIRHRRQIPDAVRASAWRTVDWPRDAYEIALKCAQ